MMTLAAFRARFPEFTTGVVGDTAMQSLLDEAALEIGDAYLDHADIAHGYLAAHLAVIWVRDNAQAAKLDPGMVVALSVPGAMSVSFNSAGVQAAMNDPYMATTYGQRFVRERTIAGKGAVAGGGSSSLTDIDSIFRS